MRTGDWLQTYTGKQFFPMDTRAGDFDILDIAHALSNICRYAGHCREFYSVAQHSVMVSQHCGMVYAIEGLMHDATEAYLADIPRPVKHDQRMLGYCLIESDMEREIADQFGLWYPWPSDVKAADDAVLMAERRDLMATPPIPWGLEHIKPIDQHIQAWSPHLSEQRFLDRYFELTGLENTASNYYMYGVYELEHA
jgi:uncharacterized protein